MVAVDHTLLILSRFGIRIQIEAPFTSYTVPHLQDHDNVSNFTTYVIMQCYNKQCYVRIIELKQCDTISPCPTYTGYTALASSEVENWPKN